MKKGERQSRNRTAYPMPKPRHNSKQTMLMRAKAKPTKAAGKAKRQSLKKRGKLRKDHAY